MTIGAELGAALGAALGAPVTGSTAIAGGDINQAYRIELGDGRALFMKTNPRSPAGMFAAEARGLGWLAEARALRVPAVVAVAETTAAQQFLVLELIEGGGPARGFDQALGRGLAALHRFGAPRFGLDHDNFVGRLPQANAGATGDGEADAGAGAGWAAFYRERRLEAQLRRAADGGLASTRMRRGFERLFGTLESLVGPDEPPSRLHGDLWGGNLMCDGAGDPCLIDPAVYGGHREIDLAMMRLFGGFGARVFAAYDQAFPLAAGHEERIPLYQLYPLMVHVNLFGGGYVGSVEAALDQLV